MAYATYSDLCKSIDSNLVADLCGDAGQPVYGDNPVVAWHLSQASGRIRAMARTRSTYTDEQLDALALASDPMLTGLTVNLAAYSLCARRGGEVPPNVADGYKQALSDLEALRDGGMIFGAVGAAANAGLPTVQAVGNALPLDYSASYGSPFYPPISSNTFPVPPGN